MSWFRKKDPTPPQPPPPSAAELEARERERALHEHVARWFTALKHKFDSLLNQRASELQTFRLPVPRISEQLTYECKSVHGLKLTFPSPHVPPHFIVYCRSDVPPPEWASFTPTVYVVTGTEGDVEGARRTYEQQGIIALRKAYPGLWLNQDPYEMYRTLELHSKNLGNNTFTHAEAIGERQASVILRFAFGTSLDSQTANLRAPLKQLRDFTPDDLRQFERRHALYNAISFGKQQYSFDAVFGYVGSILSQPRDFSRFPNDVLFTDLPEPRFSSDLAAFKLLPADTIRPNVAREFLDSLRAVTHPVAFELIDNGVAAYFQLVCATQDSSLVRHQLELHFPTAAITEHEPIAPPELRSVTARPQTMYGEVRALSEFPFDPLAQFFSLTNNQKSAGPSVLQSLFFPIPNETMNVLAEAFKAR